MNFKLACKALKEGKKIRRQQWEGCWKWRDENRGFYQWVYNKNAYWKLKDNAIKMYCGDRDILDITKDNISYFICNMFHDDWVE